MSRVAVILATEQTRRQAANWCLKAPPGTRFELKEPKRTLDQNAKMWAMLTEIARQLPWHGVRLSADDWKLLFLDALKRELRIAPNLDGTGFVNLGRSSSDLTKEEFGDLLALIDAFAAEHNVQFSAPLTSAGVG